jgi:hypothetical protein
MTPPRDQPPLFDVVMGDAVPTFHRDGDEQREAHARAMDDDPCQGGMSCPCRRCAALWTRDARP